MNKNILYGFFNGTASHDEEVQVREWMETSAENRRTFLKERRLFDAILLNVREEMPGRQRTARAGTFLKRVAGAAAVAAIAVALSYTYFLQRERAGDSALQTVSVPAGQRVNITLPDGTNVWLNARSNLSYPASFGRDKRMMTLNGEAYFEVAVDRDRPFVVQTAQGSVEVLGTSFNVDAYASESHFETTLMNGSLHVRLNGGADDGILLKPDTKATLKDGKLLVEAVNDYTRYRWREGLICFVNAPFVEIMHDFEKYYGVSVRVKNAKAKNLSFTGKFRYTDGIDYALRVLQKNIRFSYRRDDETQIIYIE
ncbi:MAG: FecR domain-containing protein [Tannerella sp.]|jgi:ferric-dicitrate binding protein FerR (iron transport regulator)|nr:FecR domain-containing protein [Tannerella sp.]